MRVKVNTVLFDLDGTLIDTNGIIMASFKNAFEKYVPELEYDEELFKTFIGPSLEQTFSQYVDVETVQLMVDEYRSYYKKNEFDYFEIYPNVIETLKELKTRGIYTGIVTTKFKEAAMPSFNHYGLGQFFDCFVALDHVEKPKPDREPVDKALMQIPHTGAIMVGDNKGDIFAGKNAGIYSCGVSWSFKGKEYLERANPDFMLEDMTDLLDILEKLNA